MQSNKSLNAKPKHSDKLIFLDLPIELMLESKIQLQSTEQLTAYFGLEKQAAFKPGAVC